MNYTQIPPHDTAILTDLMRFAWATIASGEATIAASEVMEEATADEVMDDDMTPGPRLKAAWAHRALGEDEVRCGEEEEERVLVLAAGAGIDMDTILETLAHDYTQAH